MAGTINLITPPTGGVPATTDDYNYQNILLQQLIFQYNLKQLFLTEWETLIKPQIKQGVSIHHGGSQFSVDDDNVDISGSPADGNVFIVLTRIGNQLEASFVDSAAGFEWNYIYNGFYNTGGDQLLPYVLKKFGTNYDKFMFVYNQVEGYAQDSGIVIISQIGAGTPEFHLKKSISAYMWWEWIGTGPATVASELMIYQNGDWRQIVFNFTLGVDSYEYNLQLNPGRYRIFNPDDIYNTYLIASGVFMWHEITPDRIVRLL